LRLRRLRRLSFDLVLFSAGRAASLFLFLFRFALLCLCLWLFVIFLLFLLLWRVLVRIHVERQTLFLADLQGRELNVAVVERMEFALGLGLWLGFRSALVALVALALGFLCFAIALWFAFASRFRLGFLTQHTHTQHTQTKLHE